MVLTSRIALLALVPILWTPPAVADSCTLKQILTVSTLPSEHDEILIPATVDDRPTALVLDTGAFWTVVRPSLVAGLRTRTSTVGVGGAGGSVLNHVVTTPRLQVGSVVLKDVDLIVGPEAFSPDARIGGTFAANLLRWADVEIDPAAGTVSMFSQDHCPGTVVYWPHQDLASVPLDIRKDGLITIPVELDGQHLQALVDTGAALSVVHRDAASRRFGLTPGDPGLAQTGALRTIDGRIMPVYQHRFGTLKIEGITFRNPLLAIGDDRAPGAKAVDMVLGMHQLHQLRLYFAYGEKMLYATTVAGDAVTAPSPRPRTPP